MDDPAAEIGHAINACAGAPSADAQITAFLTYFHPEASFVHPLCYVPSRHASSSPQHKNSPSFRKDSAFSLLHHWYHSDSRSRIIGIYLFYRGAVPITSFEVNNVAFDEKFPGEKGHVFVELVQRPYLRGISWLFGGWTPAVEMHINFDVVKQSTEQDGKWLIVKQEDVIQPMVRLFYVGKPIMLIGDFRA